LDQIYQNIMHFRDRGAYALYVPCVATPLYWVRSAKNEQQNSHVRRRFIAILNDHKRMKCT